MTCSEADHQVPDKKKMNVSSRLIFLRIVADLIGITGKSKEQMIRRRWRGFESRMMKVVAREERTGSYGGSLGMPEIGRKRCQLGLLSHIHFLHQAGCLLTTALGLVLQSE
jgi:hypothetical protein